MEDVQRRRLSQGRIGCQPQSFQIANRRCGLGVDAIGRIRDTRQHLERSCQVDLIDALEQEGADMQVDIMWDHFTSPGPTSPMDKASLLGRGLAEMPKSPRSSPNPIRVIDVLTYPAVQLLDVTAPVPVFASANDLVAGAGGARPYLPRVVAPGGKSVTASAGVALATVPLTPLGEALDTLLVAGGEGAEAAAENPALVEWVRQRATQARRVASVCTGALLLAAAGVLDGRRAATHWEYCAKLAKRFPAVRVEPDPIFVCDGRVWTSAGVTAGIDLALALVEEDLGRSVALAVPATWLFSSNVPADRRSSALPWPCKPQTINSARSMTGSTTIWATIFR
jgi:putative intracellular protease/amidase